LLRKCQRTRGRHQRETQGQGSDRHDGLLRNCCSEGRRPMPPGMLNAADDAGETNFRLAINQ
jgi:hypothetical protein